MVIIARHSDPNLNCHDNCQHEHSLNIIYFPNITQSNLTSFKYFSLSPALLYPRLSIISALYVSIGSHLQELGPCIICRTVELLLRIVFEGVP